MLPGGASPDVPCGDDCALHTPLERAPLHQTPERSSDAPRSGAFTLPPLRHAFVTLDHGRVPCLWMGFEEANGMRLARVLHPVLVDDGWTLIEECVPAEWVILS